jgi:cytochrome c
MGQTAGTMYADYPYSPALKTSGVVWDDETLDAFLEDPQSIIPGTVMANQPITDPIERKIIIDTLNSYCSTGSHPGFGPDNIATNAPTVPDESAPIVASTGTMSSTNTLWWTMAQTVGVSWLLLVVGSRRR